MSSIPKYKVVGETPWNELEVMLREVPLLGKPQTRPYANATMSIERFKLSDLYPTTRYVQASLVASQQAIRNSLLPQGYDQLDLHKGAILVDSGQGPQRIMPPVVERYEKEGENKYILDGGHRAELARRVALASDEKDPELTVIFIRDGIAYPPYAFVNAWDEVQVVEERPSDKSTWKNYRDFEHRYSLYRDYSKIVDSAPRG